MRALLFGLLGGLLAISSFALSSPAQVVPGRDLLRFPIGTMDRAAALAGGLSSGLGNPASIALLGQNRVRIGASALQTPADLGVTVQALTGAVALPGRLTVGGSVVRASVRDIFRTETDPQTLGGQIPYGTMLYSAAVTREHTAWLVGGLALRYRTGEADGIRRSALGLDAGALIHGVTAHDLSLGVATFLWRPGNSDGEAATVNLAADLRVAGADSVKELRAGYALAAGEHSQREHFAVGSARYGLWEGRGGFVVTQIYGERDWRGRVGFLFHYRPYAVGLAREGGRAGLPPTYQFTLTTTFE
ncbi:MAG: hypothetical protein WKG32_02455 [Gemmatimonadaceae bacterium]